jgi:hypothetical protein
MIGLAAVDQVAHQVNDGPVLRPTVDEVAQKDDGPLRVGMEPARRTPPPSEGIERSP